MNQPATAEPAQRSTGVWLYGVCADPDQIAGVAAPTPLRIVGHRDLHAVVGDSAQTPAAGSAALRAHLRVLEALHAAGTLVPAAFGTLLPDDNAVREHLLEARYEELRGLMQRLQDRVEVIVRADADDDALVETVLRSEPRLQSAHEQTLRAHSPDQRMRARIALGEQVAAAIRAHRSAARQQILNRLSPLADAVVPQEQSPGFDAAFLVARDRLERFDKAVDEAAAELPAWRFRSVGPAPPHHFVGGMWQA